MKKVAVLLVVFLLLTGCSLKSNSKKVIKEFTNDVKNAKSYKIKGIMEISNDEESFVYDLESDYLKGDYYKVRLVNKNNNHEQIILKNKEEIYVITPILNKSFKFQSEWPNNSSQSYLLDILVKDIENDKDVEISENNGNYIIKTKVNYPNNNELKYQKIYLNNKKKVEKVEVYNDKDIVKIKVTFLDIKLNTGIKAKDFKLESYIDSSENVNNDNCTENCENEQKTSVIDNIIYPLYIPSDTYLKNSEKVDTVMGNRVILTFGGEKNFVLIEEAALKNDNMEITPVYGEPLMLSESIGALSANSLSWDRGNISYYLASTELTIDEMRLIANSLGNSTLVANTK